jgi:microsomal dipeptidase-like Zn-dependent dipeptidase
MPMSRTMKRIVAPLAIILILVPAAFFVFAPRLVEQSMNKIAGPGTWPVSDAAAALHKRLTIVDLHADTLLWKRDLTQPSDIGHVDLDRLEAGNVALQVFSSVTKTPRGQNYEGNSDKTDNITLLAIGQLQPPRTWGIFGGSLLERSLWHAEKLARAEAAAAGRLRIIRSGADIDRLLADRAAGKRVTGALLSTEGAQNLEGQAANLDLLYKAGFRMMGLAHFFDNELAGSMHGEKKGGLTPFGRQMVAAMEERGIVVDLAHASHTAFADVMRVARRPVVVSHGGVKGTCNTNRNLTDDELRALARNGGVIGIGYWDAAVCGTTPSSTARAIVYAAGVAGIDHVALGSDFDGAVATGFDTAHIAAITDVLLARGMPEADIAKVMGGNALRVLRAGLQPLAAIAPPAALATKPPAA